MSAMACRAASFAFVVLVLRDPRPVAAQAWSSPAARALAERATARRAGQIADSTLPGYTAKARGTLEFLAQFGETTLMPPAIVRSSEIAVDVFWSAPNISRQVVVGLRDTSLVPIDIEFYRDRYGIVQSNFPDRIRLGDGKDVADIIHPFSRAGLEAYEVALGDSLFIRVASNRIAVQEVLFRPRDARAPRAVGSAYLDRSTGDVVRLALTFTRAALLDDRIEALSVMLENELVEGRFWLPRRQEVEVRRGGTLFDFPARGIVRGRWTICCYDLQPASAQIARTMAGPELVFRSLPEARAYPFPDSLFGDLRSSATTISSEDVARVQSAARRSVSRRMLERPAGVAFAARSVSDLVRFNRAEGLAAGVGTLVRLGAGSSIRGNARFGVDDRAAKGTVLVDLPLGATSFARIFAEREYRDVSDVAETSGARNSMSAQEFASDNTDLYDVRGAGLEMTLGPGTLFGGVLSHVLPSSLRWRLVGEYETHRPLSVRARPMTGNFSPIVPAARVAGPRISLLADGGTWRPSASTAIAADGELRVGHFARDDSTTGRIARVHVHVRVDASAGAYKIAAETFATTMTASGAPPVQQLVYLGGPLTGPGYTFHQFVGRSGMSQHIEVAKPTALAAIPVHPLGAVPLITSVALFAHAVVGNAAGGRAGVFPAVGAAAELFSGVVRMDVARGLRNGRWTFGIDAGRALWSIL